MKIYDTKTAPTPRRVRMFLAEKGIEVDYVQIDIVGGENLSAEMRAKNPLGKVPILELDDGTCISEANAICQYFEALQPEPALYGHDPLSKGIIAQWQQRAELYLFMQVGMCFQHSTGYFKDRMNPIPEFGKEAGLNAKKFMHLLDQHLAENHYLAGEQFSVADITAFTAIDFARVVKIRILPEQVNLTRWYDEIKQRPSAQTD
jgi:glutathione S-transferase